MQLVGRSYDLTFVVDHIDGVVIAFRCASRPVFKPDRSGDQGLANLQHVGDARERAGVFGEQERKRRLGPDNMARAAGLRVVARR